MNLPYVIDENEAARISEQHSDENLSRGFTERPYDSHPEGFYAPVFEGEIIPRSKWDDLIKMQDDNESSPWHVEKSMDLPHLYQNGFGYCHTEDTEVLTSKGWQKWSEYGGTDSLATVNQHTHAMEFQSPLARQCFEYDGEMIYSTNRRVDFGVTPNHRMLVRKWDENRRTLSDQYSMTTADKIGWYCGLMHAPRGWRGTELVEVGVPGGRTYDGDDFLELLATIVSDGYANKDKTNPIIGFCCYDERRVARVESLARRVGFKEQKRGNVWTSHDRALYDWVREHCYDGEPEMLTKRIPQIVKHASQRQIKNFLLAYSDQLRKKPLSAFYTSSPQIVGDLQELLLRIGKRATPSRRPPTDATMKNGHVIRGKESWSLGVAQSDRLCIDNKKHIERDRYRGLVYCATVPNGTLVTRRNGKVLISGNCWCYGLTNGVQNRYGAAGHRLHLSAFAVAYQGKNRRNQGGWAGEAIRYVEQFGIPTENTWPNLNKDWSLRNDPDQKADAARHGIVEFRELPKNNFDAAMSVLLDPIEPCPVTLGLSWWGHLVCGVKGVKVDGGYGIIIKNSWGTNWGDEGFGTLVERKAIAHEYIQVSRAKVRAA